MKNTLLILACMFLTCTSLSAQTVVQNSESANREEETANCWRIQGFDYTVESPISGKYSLISTDMNGEADYIYMKSPWVKLRTGNITLKARMLKEDKEKQITFAFIPVLKEDEDQAVQFYTYKWPDTKTDVKTISVAVPSAIRNDGKAYKIKIGINGNRGDAGIIIDDFTIPATYYSDPSNDCKAMSLSEESQKDDDKDGVSNKEDDYHTDENRAYDNFYPASGDFGTLMFEDLWPSKGDYDFNDLVVGYKFNTVTNAKGLVTEIRYTFKLRAIGASYHNGFAFQLDNIASEDVVSVKVEGNIKADWAKIADNGTEAEQKFANIIVFDDAYNVLPSPGGSGVNVKPEAPYVDPKEMTVVVSFVDEKGNGKNLHPFEELNPDRFNPYIIINQQRGAEVHLADYAPSGRADFKLFGTSNDNTNPDKGTYYKTKNNLPWAINVVDEIPYTIELQNFLWAYPVFGDWAESSGQKATDWYTDKSDYRNNKFLYIR